jgi:hypothetical protein
MKKKKKMVIVIIEGLLVGLDTIEKPKARVSVTMEKIVKSKRRIPFTIDRILTGLDLTVSRPVDHFCDVNVIGLRTVDPTDNGIDGNKSGLYALTENIVLRLVLSRPRVSIERVLCYAS